MVPPERGATRVNAGKYSALRVARVVLKRIVMRIHHIVLATSLLFSCVDDPGHPGDGEDDVAIGDGKSDAGGAYTACQLDAVVTWLNHGAAVDDLDVIVLDPDAAAHLLSRRDGADGAFGTSDDRLFRDAYDVDAVPFVGPLAFAHLVDAGAKICRDPYLEARDITRAVVRIPRLLPPPAAITRVASQAYPDAAYRVVDMGDPYHPEEFYEQATPSGKWCLQAMVARFDQLLSRRHAGIDALFARARIPNQFWLSVRDFSATTATAAAAEIWISHAIYFKPSALPNGDCTLPTPALIDAVVARCLTYLETHTTATGCEGAPL